ncbi:unnamed protein product [Caenorhabditis brenneri]
MANNTGENQEMEWRKILQAIDSMKKLTFQEIAQDAMRISRLERFLGMLEIKKSDVLIAFGIDEELGLAAFNMMNQRFICTEQPRNFVLQVVHESRTRSYGEVARVGHIGAMSF